MSETTEGVLYLLLILLAIIVCVPGLRQRGNEFIWWLEEKLKGDK